MDALLQSLLRDIEKRIEWYKIRPDFVAITGDIAYSGQPPEYELARKFFDELLHTTGLNKSRLFLVPGNHDVDRALISQGARSISDSLTDGADTGAILEDPNDRQLMFARFAGFAAFVNGYLGDYLLFDHDHYFYVQTLNLLERRVTLLGLNSAWLCSGIWSIFFITGSIIAFGFSSRSMILAPVSAPSHIISTRPAGMSFGSSPIFCALSRSMRLPKVPVMTARVISDGLIPRRFPSSAIPASNAAFAS